MTSFFKATLTALAMVAAGQAMAQVTFYQDDNYKGAKFTTERPVENFRQSGFKDKASSVIVTGKLWEVCDRPRLGGQCMVLRPGQYPSLSALGLDQRIASVRAVGRNERIDESRYAPVAAAVPSNAQVIFYANENFQGQSFTAQSQVDDFTRFGFNDRASSVVVLGDQWEACENVRFGGRCVVLRPGRYPSLAAMGMEDRVSSIRGVAATARVNDERYAPLPAPVYDNRRCNEERLYEVNVTSVRAVVAAPEKRCWMEREPVATQPGIGSNPNIGGAIAGAVIGGILGHQVGGGTGKQIATVGGAVAGAAVGANVGRISGGGQQVAGQDVQKCDTVPSQAKTEFWDVTYTFRGQEHTIQTTTQPGRTITVNGQGEPRT
ncbi:MAG: 17 kDa surface antigen [Polaromonas sp.]|nr:17 kDa surface antigen [Polaromonas sp.]